MVCRPNGLVASLTILLVQLSTSMSVSESDKSPELDVDSILDCFAAATKDFTVVRSGHNIIM